MSTATAPRVCDNDRDEITVTLDGKEIRGWSYENEAERRVKMLAAREFCEGWFQGREPLAEELAATLEELIDRTGDDMIDSRARRIAELRPVALASRQTKDTANV